MANDRPLFEQLRVAWRRRVHDAEGRLAAAREEVRKLEEQLRSQASSRRTRRSSSDATKGFDRTFRSLPIVPDASGTSCR